MKKNERRMILFLVVIAAIIIAVLVVVKNKNNSGEKSNSSSSKTTTSSSSSSSNNSKDSSSNSDAKVNNEKFVEVLQDGTKLNVSNKLSETKKVGNYEISNIQLTTNNGQSTILADVKNVGSANIDTTFVQIVLVDEAGAEITSMNAIIGQVAAGDTVQLNASATVDFANAYDFNINVQ